MSNNLHLAWSRLLARGLAASGVRDVVISPGSRSTPLVLGFDAEDSLRKHTVIDERAAAFFALGIARAELRPVALLCTSGTAGAHYFPAIIEASQSHVPLVVITADRPWEAYDCAASQTVDQVKLFGAHVRHQAELGLPDPDALPAVLRLAAQAAHRSQHPTPGPVHINARFRKPLEPVDAPRPEPHDAAVARLLQAGPPRCWPADSSPAAAGVQALAALCREHPRGLIVAGPAATAQRSAAREVRALSELLGYPLCAETTSQLRHGAPGPLDIPGFDLLFRSRPFIERHRPGLIIELGMPPVAGAYGSWLASRPAVARAVIAPHGWNDPHGDADLLLWASPGAAIGALRAALAGPSATERSWGEGWARAQRVIDERAAPEVAAPRLTEAAVARAVAAHTPPGATLLVGNSGPIRDLDLYGGALQSDVRVIHQRGAAGIDGWLAAAAGVKAASEAPAVLFLGDISLLHDVGSLALVAGVRTSLVIVVTNNNGGRIFEQLPLARRGEVAAPFERHFITPHGLTFEAVTQAWGVRYHHASTPAALHEALDAAHRHAGPSIVEAAVDPSEAARRRAAFWSDLAPLLEALPGARA